MTDFEPLAPFQIDLRRQIFLGYGQGSADTGGRLRAWSGDSDSVGIVGPPRYGKSSGLIIPNLFTWAGPAVVTSTRGDLLNATGNWRRQIAAQHGGDVYVYDPFASEPGIKTLRWSPLANCDDPAVAYRRVAAMTAVLGRGISDGEHWRGGAAQILRAMFHAAALGGKTLLDVRRWIAKKDPGPAVDILRETDHLASAEMWADDLLAVDRSADKERSSFFSVARGCLDAAAEPHVADSCAAVDLDVDHFLRTRSTLYIVGPSHYQEVLAPLIVGLVDSIAQRAAELAAADGGRLTSELLLALDEVANIAPLRSLPSLVSEGGGRGIITMWAAQSLAQLRERYGADGQSAIVTATTAKIIYGGLSNGNDLRDISAWAGEIRESQATYRTGGPKSGPSEMAPKSTGGFGDQDMDGDRSITSTYRPALPIAAIQQMPPFHAYLWYRSNPPRQVDTRPAALVEQYEPLFGYTPPASESG